MLLQIPGNPHEWLYKFVAPALAALIGPALTAMTKMGLDMSRTRRSDKLTERITKLCEQIRGLPEFPPEDCTGCSPRQALVAEMNVAIQELSELQKKKHATIRINSATVTARVRSLLLLFRPHGFRAWLVHLLFWCYAVVYVFVMTVLVSPNGTGSPDTDLTHAESAVLLIVAAGALSIPCLVLNLIANTIRRKQLDAAAKVAAAPTVVTTVMMQAVPEGEKVSV